MRPLVFLLVILALSVSTAASQQTSGEWVSAGAGPLNTKYSQVQAISSGSVERLYQDWFLPVPPSRTGGMHGVTHPLLIKYGVGYAVTNSYLVLSFDMRGGKIFWTIELQQPPLLNPSVSTERLGHLYQVLLAKRGSDELLVVGTHWQRVYMLDSFTGKLVHSLDIITPNESVEGNAGRYGGMPLNFAYDSRRNILVVGSTSPDSDAAGRGFIEAYSLGREGLRKLWRTFLMPPQTNSDPDWSINLIKNTRYAWMMDGDKAVDLKTVDVSLLRSDWMTAAGSPPKAGVMASWMSGWAVDEERGVVFIGVSSPLPSLNADGRTGPNIPSSSVLAVKVDTGEVLWLFQAIPHDVWGYGCNGGVSLVGNTVLALCGNGRVYALDRETGRLAWMFTPAGLRPPSFSLFDKNQMQTPYMGYGVVKAGETITTTPPPYALLSYAVNPNTGRVYYAFPLHSETYEIKPPLKPKSFHSFSKQSDLVLYSIDVSTGRVVWERKLEKVGSSYVSASSDILLVQTSSSGFYVFSEKDGSPLYSKQAIGTSMIHPSVGVDVEGSPRIVISMSSVDEPGYIASFGFIPPSSDQAGTVSVVTEHVTITRTSTLQLDFGQISGGGFLLMALVAVIAASAFIALFYRSKGPRISRTG
ncbi:MAG: PQQ-binding-like beta-propeller repeat protein [Candidatus Caldarchaeum sp.]|nr:PQQ-binding-like beta-propeller repeat protein [Candidatus Caldarchaeum sp.]MDW8359291.1 PQQ-binding-like beta-propeller repeat protein [Candidatus Caldarchaeum sp.]